MAPLKISDGFTLQERYFAEVYMCTYTYVYTHIQINIYVLIIYIYVHVYICTYVCVYACMHACVYYGLPLTATLYTSQTHIMTTKLRNA